MDRKNNKKWLLIGIIGVVVLAVIICCVLLIIKKDHTDKKEIDEKSENLTVGSLEEFNYSFLKLEEGKKNMIYSPLSIKYALYMLNEGAEGKTKEEIESVLGDNFPTKYKNIDKVLSVANSLFIRDEYKDAVKESYIKLLEEKYDAEIIFDKFESADNVNNWISKKTFEIIKKMLTDDQVRNPDLMLMLINALAIDMEWEYSFNTNSTQSVPFENGSGKTLDVAMMNYLDEYSLIKYYKDDDYSAVSLPLQEYENTELEFIAIMPNDNNLSEMVKDEKFDDNLEKIFNGLHKDSSKYLSISIPRFEFDYSLNLNDDLKKLGIETAFTSNANFSKMSDIGLNVGEALHKANIMFSESGIKAAAVTVIMVDKNSIMPMKETEKIVFDKPFMFVIKDKKTGDNWFVGTVYEPILWKDVEDDYK